MQSRNDSVDSPDGKKGLFEDFSFSTVIASGLAAATSFALASQIGIAGSIIGTLIGGFASAAASQVYRSLLSASADKLRQVGPAGGEAAADRHDGLSAPRDADATVAATADPTHTIFRRPAVGLGAVEEVAESGTPIAPAEVRAVARAAEHRRQRRRATAVVAAVSIAAVLVFALVVGFVTQGRGIGTKPSAPAAQEQPQASGQAQTTTTEDERKDGERTDAKKDAKKDDASGTVSSTTEGGGQQKTDSSQSTTGTGDSASQGTGASGGAGTGTGAGGGATDGNGNTSSSEGAGTATGGNTSSSTGAGTTTDGNAGTATDSTTTK